MLSLPIITPSIIIIIIIIIKIIGLYLKCFHLVLSVLVPKLEDVGNEGLGQ
jgi:hypothetical protein